MVVEIMRTKQVRRIIHKNPLRLSQLLFPSIFPKEKITLTSSKHIFFLNWSDNNSLDMHKMFVLRRSINQL